MRSGLQEFRKHDDTYTLDGASKRSASRSPQRLVFREHTLIAQLPLCRGSRHQTSTPQSGRPMSELGSKAEGMAPLSDVSFGPDGGPCLARWLGAETRSITRGR
jgi:hypothetical protein